MTWLRQKFMEIEAMRRARVAARPKWPEFHVAYRPKPINTRTDADVEDDARAIREEGGE